MHDAPWEHVHGVFEPIAGQGDAVVWTTVGFDVGSATSQVVFSRITLARRDASYVVVDRSILHQSEVILTPYAEAETIDGAALARFVAAEYAAAGLSQDEVDTGAVILTGLALSKANSHAVAQAVADDSGRFVAVAAGDVMEAKLAANGAGVAALSLSVDGTLAHIDVGGGTTKLSLWNKGRLLGLAAVDVGARLVTFDPEGAVARCEPPARLVAGDLKLELPAQGERLAQAMARDVLRYAHVLPGPPKGPDLLRTPPLAAPAEPVSAVVFTGGVSEYVYGREERRFGDLGLWLGLALREGLEDAGVALVPFERGIRATVLGVSQHSVQLSGATVYVSDPARLPIRNLPLIAPHLHLHGEAIDAGKVRDAVERAWRVRAAGENDLKTGVALAWEGSATFDRLSALSEGLVAALRPTLSPGDPFVAVVEGDVAGLLGVHLEERLGADHPVVSLDGVHIHEFDHVDIGELSPVTGALPVVVKSLLFAGPPRQDHAHDH